MTNYQESPLLAGLRGWQTDPSPTVQRELVDHMIVGLREYYAHLPLKQSSLGIDPVEQLRLLGATDPAEHDGFIRRVVTIVNGLRDRHTSLTLPAPWRALLAYLPFVVERVFVGNQQYFVVAKHLFGFDDIPLGSVVTHWNGAPIETHVARLADVSQGANRAASMSLAVTALTVRPLAYELMPDEDWVTTTSVDPGGNLRTTSTPWRFYDNSAAGGHVASGTGTAMGLDHQHHMVSLFKAVGDTSESEPFAGIGPGHELVTDPATGMRYGDVETGHGPVGYLRIFSFEVPDAGVFVQACERILRSLNQQRLIIDVRGNPGGVIPAGQELVRMLSSREFVSASPVAFRNTAGTRSFGGVRGFEPWQLSLGLQYATGQQFSQAWPMTNYHGVPSYRYPGRVGLVIDALCYSTTDFFAADFKDNEIGVVIGTDASTGGGGANVWTWDILQQAVQASGGHLPPLPGGFGFNVSVRRSVRTGAERDLPVEGRGVAADVVHRPTLNDALGGNTDLINFVSAHLQ